MLLRRKQELFPGYMAKDVRNLLRKVQRYSRFYASALAPQLLSLLEADGYIRPCSQPQPEPMFEFTDKGIRLCAARVGKPISRLRADTLLQEVLDRASAFNLSPGRLRIAQILVFGSYVDNNEDELNDLELGVETRPRPGVSFSFDLLREHDRVLAKLRNRSPYIGFCGLGFVERFGLTYRQVFPERCPLVRGNSLESVSLDEPESVDLEEATASHLPQGREPYADH